MTGDPRQDDGPTLVEILGDAAPAGSGSPCHDDVAARMRPIVEASTGSARFQVEFGDSLATVAGWVFEATGRPLGAGPTWARIVDPARGTGLVAVIHSPLSLPGGGGEADLILVGHRGMLSRGVVRDLARWAFLGIGLRRVVVRIPAHDTDLADLARRAGFTHEGRARSFHGPGADASVWAISADRCRWLPRAPAFAPNLTPPISTRVQ